MNNRFRHYLPTKNTVSNGFIINENNTKVLLLENNTIRINSNIDNSNKTNEAN